jgi:hypothetical protein
MIKVPNNAEKDVYSYLRIFNDESFLIILNFGEKQQHCQLKFPDHFIEENFKKDLKLENMLTSEQIRTQFLQQNRVEFDLNKESAYIYKIY